MLEVSTASYNISLQLLWEVFHSFVYHPLGQVDPDNLKCFLEFGDCFRLFFKLVVSTQYCIPHVIVHWVQIRRIWRPLVFCDEIWTVVPQPVLCAPRCVCWHAVLLEDESGQQAIAVFDEIWKNDNLVIIYKQDNDCLLKHHSDVIDSKLVSGFWKLDSIFSLNILNAEKSVGGHVKKSITSSFFHIFTFYRAVRCRTLQEIML